MLYNIKTNKGTKKNDEENSIMEFCKMIFPDVNMNITNPGWLHGQSIIAPTNKEVDVINDIMEGWIPGTATMLTISYTLEDYYDVMQINVEFIQTHTPMAFLFI